MTKYQTQGRPWKENEATEGGGIPYKPHPTINHELREYAYSDEEYSFATDKSKINMKVEITLDDLDDAGISKIVNDLFEGIQNAEKQSFKTFKISTSEENWLTKKSIKLLEEIKNNAHKLSTSSQILLKNQNGTVFSRIKKPEEYYRIKTTSNPNKNEVENLTVN